MFDLFGKGGELVVMRVKPREDNSTGECESKIRNSCTCGKFCRESGQVEVDESDG